MLEGGERHETLIMHPVKHCLIPMTRQGLPPLSMLAADQDVPAYTGYEVDRGAYGALARARATRADSARSGQLTFVDIGANIGFVSIALAPSLNTW